MIEAVEKDTVEATEALAVSLQPVLCSKHQAALLVGRDAGARTAIAGVLAQPDFDKHGDVALPADQVDLAARHTEVSFDHAQSAALQPVGGKLLGKLAVLACLRGGPENAVDERHIESRRTE